MAKKKSTDAPDYKNKPSGVSIVVYDMQGDPLSDGVKNEVLKAVEQVVKESNIKSLAIATGV